MEKDIINTNLEEQCEDSFSIPVELDFTEFDEKLTMMQEALSEVLSDVLAQAIVDPDSNLDIKELLSDENTSDEEKKFADYEYEEEDNYDNEEDNIYDEEDDYSNEEDKIYDEEDDYYDDEDNIYDEEDDYSNEEDNIYDEEDDYYDEEDSIYDEEDDYYDEEDSIYDEEDNYYDEEDDYYDEEDDYYDEEDDYYDEEDNIYDEEDDYYDEEDVYKDSFYENNEYQPDNNYNHRDKTSRSSHFTPLFGRHKSQSSHGSTSRNASSYNPFDTHGESSFDWTDRDGDGYDDRDDGFWTEREF